MMQQLYTAALAGGQAKDDLSGIIRLYEEMAGLPPRGPGDAVRSKEAGGRHV
jgi:hypothetical protein